MATNWNEIDSFKETDVKNVWRFITISDRLYYKFSDETGDTRDCAEFDTIEQAVLALNLYVIWLNTQRYPSVSSDRAKVHSFK